MCALQHQNKKAFFRCSQQNVVVWSTLLTKRKNNNTQMPRSMKPPPAEKLGAVFFYFIFFFPSRVNCRRVAYTGMLPGSSCFKLNSWASTPPPLLATMSQTLKSLMEVGGEKKAQCATTAIGNDKVRKKWGGCKHRADLLIQGFVAITPNATSGAAGQLGLLEKKKKKDCWAGQAEENRWIITDYKRRRGGF